MSFRPKISVRERMEDFGLVSFGGREMYTERP